MIRVCKIAIALPMLLILSVLMLISKIISKLYCLGAGIVFIPLLICIALAVMTMQWSAVVIFGILMATSFVILFGMGWIMFQIETGQEFFKGLLRG